MTIKISRLQDKQCAMHMTNFSRTFQCSFLVSANKHGAVVHLDIPLLICKCFRCDSRMQKWYQREKKMIFQWPLLSSEWLQDGAVVTICTLKRRKKAWKQYACAEYSMNCLMCCSFPIKVTFIGLCIIHQQFLYKTQHSGSGLIRHCEF